MDLHSRFILEIDAPEEARTSFAKAALRALFRRPGVPEIIRVDNGAPLPRRDRGA